MIHTSFMPHGYCYLWQPSLVSLHVLSDGVIALSYFMIPFLLAYLVYTRKDIPYGFMFFCFSLFIISCGLTHLMEIWNLWHANYWLGGFLKLVTAIVSFTTAILLLKLLPVLIKIPSFEKIAEVHNKAQAAEIKLRKILEATPDSMIIINKSGEIIFINNQTIGLFGYTREELIGKKVEMLIPEQYRAIHPQHREDFFANPHTRPMGIGMALYGERKNSEAFPVEISLSPLETEEGIVALAAIRDISDRVRIEHSKNILSAIVENAYDSIIGTDLAGTITSWNKAAETLYKYRADEIIGKSYKNLIPDQDAKEFDYIFKNLSDGMIIEPFRTKRKDKFGHILSVALTISPIKNASGKTIGVSFSGRDIAEQLQLEEQLYQNLLLEEQNRQIIEADRLKTAFLANMSHELRTPLNGIIGFSEIIYHESHGPLSAVYKDYVNEILVSSKYLLRLINDILDISKIEAGKIEIHPEKLDASKLINEIISSLTPLIDEKKISFSITNKLEKEIVLDPYLLKQILYNYISNAIKFTVNGGKVKIKLIQQNEKYFKIAVLDSGIGISKKDINKLFSEFKQLDSSMSKNFKGTGLGLALTKKIVEAMQGHVAVRSKLNKGSIFYAYLPCKLNQDIPDTEKKVLVTNP